jgi:hypothetical protein
MLQPDRGPTDAPDRSGIHFIVDFTGSCLHLQPPPYAPPYTPPLGGEPPPCAAMSSYAPAIRRGRPCDTN